MREAEHTSTREVPGGERRSPDSGRETDEGGRAEFACAIPGDLEAARHRVTDVRRNLDSRWPGAGVSVGPAQVEHADSLESVLARADSALYADKALPAD